MSVRTDFTLDWESSPRIVTIAAPSVTTSIQDLHDTLASIQDSIEGSEFPDLISSSGKGGGVTGIVSILQNAQILFEPRTTKIQTGTVTTASTGRVLIDSLATMQTNGVIRGDMAVNVTDGSHATVVLTDSETQATTLQLAGGIDNLWSIGDSYEIFDYVLATITGGDLFAVDDVGADISPILNSFGVFGPIVEQSTSPSAVPLQPGTVMDGVLTAQDTYKILNAVLGGKVSGVTTSQEKFRNPGDTKDRVTVNLDGSGNRTSVVLDLT